jgi:hypothetical protein
LYLIGMLYVNGWNNFASSHLKLLFFEMSNLLFPALCLNCSYACALVAKLSKSAAPGIQANYVVTPLAKHKSNISSNFL